MRIFNSYDEYIHSEEWQKRRLQILKRDNYQCQRCGSAKQLRVHHIHYPEVYGEEPDEDLITLCDSCHTFVHKSDIQEKQKKASSNNYNRFRAEQGRNWANMAKCRDFIYGGRENMCSLDLLKDSAERYARSHGVDYVPVMQLQVPLGQMHCMAVKVLYSKGFTEEEIYNMTPLQLNTIKKYIQTTRKYSKSNNDPIPYEEQVRKVMEYVDSFKETHKC